MRRFGHSRLNRLRPCPCLALSTMPGSAGPQPVTTPVHHRIMVTNLPGASSCSISRGRTWDLPVLGFSRIEDGQWRQSLDVDAVGFDDADEPARGQRLNRMAEPPPTLATARYAQGHADPMTPENRAHTHSRALDPSRATPAARHSSSTRPPSRSSLPRHLPRHHSLELMHQMITSPCRRKPRSQIPVCR
jgi:hypothetical protein